MAAQELIDAGFNSEFSTERIDEICRFFSSEDDLQALVNRFHADDQAIDMKRGEFYPEILRAVMSLKLAISRVYDINPQQIHPNFGCNGCIDTLMMAIKLREVRDHVDSAAGGGMLVATPTYFRNYNSCVSKKLRMIKVPLRKPDYAFDVDAMVEHVKRERPTVVWLVTPNNPTGVAIADADITNILDTAPDDTIIAIDRTLVNIRPEIATRDLIQRYSHKQLVIMHSFSKYAGMSHLRVGFALFSNAELAEEVRPLLPLGLGVEGAVKSARLLNAQKAMKPSASIVSNIVGNKSILDAFCSSCPTYQCTDFVGNYCLLTLPQGMKSQPVDQHLRKAGIYVMPGCELPEPQDDVLRIHTGGAPELMLRTTEILKRLKP